MRARIGRAARRRFGCRIGWVGRVGRRRRRLGRGGNPVFTNTDSIDFGENTDSIDFGELAPRPGRTGRAARGLSGF